jgi:mono/diheme cytochrome c family protein
LKRAAIIAGICLACVRGHDIITTKVTWNREISRIVYNRCARCHHPAGAAFPLATYAEARPWAAAIKEEVEQRRMPPWGAVKGFGDFRNDEALTPEQIELVVSWASGGAPEGDAKDLPPAQHPAEAASTPPPRAGITVTRDTRLRSTLVLDGLWPQSISSGASFRVTAEMPGGSIEPLLWIDQYQPRFPHSFLLRAPLKLPRGAIIHGVPEGSALLLFEPTADGSPAHQTARY